MFGFWKQVKVAFIHQRFKKKTIKDRLKCANFGLCININVKTRLLSFGFFLSSALLLLHLAFSDLGSVALQNKLKQRERGEYKSK